MCRCPLQVAAASFPFLARFGTGAFASGYKSGLVPDDGKYGVATVGGRKVSETSQVSYASALVSHKSLVCHYRIAGVFSPPQCGYWLQQ